MAQQSPDKNRQKQTQSGQPGRREQQAPSRQGGKQQQGRKRGE